MPLQNFMSRREDVRPIRYPVSGPHRSLQRAKRTAALAQLIVALAAWSAPAHAVVITTGDGTGNTSAPPDDPGFDHVGDKGTTGVYLGDRWVLTANHANATDIDFGGTNYAAVAGTEVQLMTGALASDLLIYRVWPEPPLPGVTLADSTPLVGETVTMIGRGNNRSIDKTYWDGSWLEVIPPAAYMYEGWKQSPGRTIRWGTNEITLVGFDLTAAGTTSREFGVDFDDFVDEGQAVQGDSGGAVFVKRAGQWQLLGIMNLVSSFVGQPTKTEVFGNRTYSIDIPFYRDQILAVMATGVPASDQFGRAALIGLFASFGIVAACRRIAD